MSVETISASRRKMRDLCGKAQCGCDYHAEQGIPCQHDLALAGLPSDYEPCETCGFDHAYDWPVMTAEQRAEAELAHKDIS